MSTALVPVAASDSSAHASAGAGRPRSDFLAHMIATLAQAPQTRMRRRADPAEAVAVYGAIERGPPPQRHTVFRSL